MTAISVIVPIYKAENKLLKCLKSLESQSWNDFEALLIDDGSPDNCGKIIDEYAKKDSRFKAFHKQNGGVSSARQFGIDHSTGKYSIQVDPDDWVESDMLKDLYFEAEKSKADIVICDFYEDSDKGLKYFSERPSSLAYPFLLHSLFEKLHGFVWNKLIRLSCYRKYNVRFPQELSFCEDQYVIASFLKHKKISVAYLPKAYYHYCRNYGEDSLSKSYNHRMLQEDKRAIELFSNLLQGTGIEDEIQGKKTYSMIARAFWYGSDFYSSKLFKKTFGKYKESIMNSPKNGLERILIIYSIKGYYQPIIQIVKGVLYAKHKIYSLKNL